MDWASGFSKGGRVMKEIDWIMKTWLEDDGIDGSEGAILGSDDVIVDYYKSSADSAEVTNR